MAARVLGAMWPKAINGAADTPRVTPMGGVSVIIPTFNRSRSLARALDSLGRARPLVGVPVEVVVVDNNSTDDTRGLMERLRGDFWFDLRYCQEATQGSNHARNRGITEAAGDVLVFTDDDVTFDPGWLTEMVSTLDRHPDAIGATGRVLPVFEGGRPEWLTDAFLQPLGLQDLSPSIGSRPSRLRHDPSVAGVVEPPRQLSLDFEFQISPPDFPVEMSMVLRRSAFDALGLFSTNGCRDATSLRSNDGKAFFHRAAACGRKVIYTPHALLYHMIPDERATLGYLQRRFFWQGVSDVEFDARHNGTTRWALLSREVGHWFGLGSAGRLLHMVTGGHRSPRTIYWHWRCGELHVTWWCYWKAGVVYAVLRELVRGRGSEPQPHRHREGQGPILKEVGAPEAGSG